VVGTKVSSEVSSAVSDEEDMLELQFYRLREMWMGSATGGKATSVVELGS
jgi:hypothetical protein